MAKVVETVVTTVKGQGGKRKYAWDEWLDGRAHMLTLGEDYGTERGANSRKDGKKTPSEAAQHVITLAGERLMRSKATDAYHGCRLAYEVKDGGKSLLIQVYRTQPGDMARKGKGKGE